MQILKNRTHTCGELNEDSINQVVILTPTTLLAEQHEKTFTNRFKNWPFNIKCLSRFKSKKEQDNIISEIKNGQCNIIVGTHKVIQKDKQKNN